MYRKVLNRCHYCIVYFLKIFCANAHEGIKTTSFPPLHPLFCIGGWGGEGGCMNNASFCQIVNRPSNLKLQRGKMYTCNEHAMYIHVEENIFRLFQKMKLGKFYSQTMKVQVTRILIFLNKLSI